MIVVCIKFDDIELVKRFVIYLVGSGTVSADSIAVSADIVDGIRTVLKNLQAPKKSDIP